MYEHSVYSLLRGSDDRRNPAEYLSRKAEGFGNGSGGYRGFALLCAIYSVTGAGEGRAFFGMAMSRRAAVAAKSQRSTPDAINVTM